MVFEELGFASVEVVFRLMDCGYGRVLTEFRGDLRCWNLGWVFFEGR